MKLKEVIYTKLLLQAEEAKEQQLNKLASGILSAIGAYPEDEMVSYASKELQEDIHQGLWKLAACVLKYHDLDSVDAEKLDEVIEVMANNFIEQIENKLNIENNIGPLEPKVIGQK